MAANPAISFIGLGAMGFGMATHLVKQGYSVRGFDAYAPTLSRFATAGGEPATSVAACVQDRPVCIVMVATAAQAEAALFGGDSPPAAASLPQGAVLLLCSTVPAAWVRGLAGQLADRGRPDVLLVDSPVSGGALRAADGTLSIMAGGSEAALAAADGVLRELSGAGKLYAVRGGVGAGSNMKMCHQVLAACQILGAAEAVAFAARLGLDPARASRAIVASEGWSWMLENRAPRLLDRGFQPVASALAIIAKDAAIITGEARRLGFPAAMVGAAEQAYLAGAARGWAADDDAGVARLYLPGGASVADYAAAHGAAADDPARLALVVKLAKSVNTLAAAEALALARVVRIDLAQLHDLAVAAAGGSWVLREGAGVGLVALLGESGSAAPPPTQEPDSMGGLLADLRDVLDAAAEVKCPLYLASAAYGVAAAVMRGEKPGAHSIGLLARNYVDIKI